MSPNPFALTPEDEALGQEIEALYQTKPYQEALQGIRDAEALQQIRLQNVPKAQVDLTPLQQTVNTLTGMTMDRPLPQMAVSRPPDTNKYLDQIQEAADQLQGRKQALLKEASQTFLSRNRMEDLSDYRDQLLDLRKRRLGSSGTGFTPYQTELQLNKISKTMEPISTINSTLRDLDAAVGGFKNYQGGEKGGLDVTAQVDFLDPLRPAKAQEVKNLFSELSESLLRARSGAAINEQEYTRLKGLLGATITGGTREKVIAIKRFARAFKDTVRNKEAGFSPEVRDRYVSGGGFSSEMVPDFGDAVSQIPRKSSTPAPSLDQMSEAELEAWVKKNRGGR